MNIGQPVKEWDVTQEPEPAPEDIPVEANPREHEPAPAETPELVPA